jgi:hypothetical protein
MPPIERLKFMLPDFLVEHFEVVSFTNTEEILHLYFKRILNLQKSVSPTN